MTTTTQVILDTTEYGTESGNYDGSSQDWASNAVRAVNYYRGYGSVQTVTMRVTGFEGIIYIESTLDTDPDSAAWFESYSLGDGSTTPLTDYHPANIVGNFTWIRARVQGFSGGTINSITITY